MSFNTDSDNKYKSESKRFKIKLKYKVGSIETNTGIQPVYQYLRFDSFKYENIRNYTMIEKEKEAFIKENNIKWTNQSNFENYKKFKEHLVKCDTEAKHSIFKIPLSNNYYTRDNLHDYLSSKGNFFDKFHTKEIFDTVKHDTNNKRLIQFKDWFIRCGNDKHKYRSKDKQGIIKLKDKMTNVIKNKNTKQTETDLDEEEDSSILDKKEKEKDYQLKKIILLL